MGRKSLRTIRYPMKLAAFLLAALLAVGAGSRAAGGEVPPSAASVQVPAEPAGGISLTATADKDQAVPGEAITVTVTFIHRDDLTVRDVRFPRILSRGLSVSEAGAPVRETLQRDGQALTSVTFTYRVTGTMPGPAMFGPAELTCSVLTPATGTAGQGFFGDTEARPVQLKTGTLPLTIVPFPREGRPPGFTGVVGSFRLERHLDRAAVQAGDPVTITTTITGEGTFDRIRCPQLPGQHSLTAYPPQASLQAGKTVCEQVVIPRQPGDIAIPSISLGTFDPARRSYRLLKGGPLAITVTQPSLPEPRPVVNRNIPSKPASVPHPSPVTWTTVWAIVVGLVSCLLAVAAVRYRSRTRRDQIRDRGDHSPPSPPQAPPPACAEPEPDDTDGFHDALFRALQHRLGRVCGISPRSVTAAQVDMPPCSTLLDEGTRSGIRELFSECDRVRYGNGHHERAMRTASLALYAEICRVITGPGSPPVDAGHC